MTRGTELIAAERTRQIREEGYTAKDDDRYHGDALAVAGALYALPDDLRDITRYQVAGKRVESPRAWPWPPGDWKPTPDDRVRELVKAGALIAAEIDRLLRRKRKAA